MESTKVRDCNTCAHHVQGVRVDDTPPICWDCLNQMRMTNTDLPYWKEKDMSEEPITTPNVISNPPHYTMGRNIEPIEVIEDWELGFHLGCALKYISRAGRKDDYKQDLKKAVWYLERAINNEF